MQPASITKGQNWWQCSIKLTTKATNQMAARSTDWQKVSSPVSFFKWYKVGAKWGLLQQRKGSYGEVCSVTAHGCRGGRGLSFSVCSEFPQGVAVLRPAWPCWVLIALTAEPSPALPRIPYTLGILLRINLVFLTTLSLTLIPLPSVLLLIGVMVLFSLNFPTFKNFQKSDSFVYNNFEVYN